MRKKLNHDPQEYEWDFSLRKDLHIKFYTNVHHQFKTSCANLKVSMQEVLQELAQRIIDDDPRILEIISEYKREKRNKEQKTLIGKANIDELYEIIEDDNPLKKTK